MMAETRYVGMMFSPESIQQIVAGNKTQTRRPVKARRLPNDAGWEPHIDNDGLNFFRRNPAFEQFGVKRIKVPCKPGDIIYVKEAWGTGTRPHPYQGWVDGFEYKADMQFLDGDDDLLPLYPCEEYDFGENPKIGWQSPMYMPKVATRHFLEVLDVRIERLQDISQYDAKQEGVMGLGLEWAKKNLTDEEYVTYEYLYSNPDERRIFCIDYVGMYAKLWDSVNRGKNRPKWADNPLVFAITFRYLEDHKPAFQ